MKSNQPTRNNANYKQEQISKIQNQPSFFTSLFLPFTVNEVAREYLKSSEEKHKKLEQRINEMSQKMEKDMEEISTKLENLELKGNNPSM